MRKLPYVRDLTDSECNILFETYAKLILLRD